jgi:hypothetical protein
VTTVRSSRQARELPPDRPLYIGEIARWRREKTKTVRRDLLKLDAMVRRMYEREAAELGEEAAAARWDKDGILIRGGSEGNGGTRYQVHSLLRVRRYRGFEHFCERLWSPEEAAQVIQENKQLRRELRAVQQRVRELERVADVTLAIAQGDLPVRREERRTPEEQPDPWAEEPSERESGVQAVIREETGRGGSAPASRRALLG